MRYFVGVDGGNSKTHALLADETGRVLGFGRGGCGNHQARGLEKALQVIQRTVDSAVRAAGLEAAQIELGCFCMAGADFPEDYALLQQAVQGLFPAWQVIVKNDTMAALRAGLTRPWGVVVICGSGFNAGGRAPDGSELVLPGLGPISGDWGGGGALGMEVIRSIMRAWDGRGQPTLLTGLALEALSAPDEPALLSRLYHGEIPEVRLRDLAPLVFEAALARDQVAQELLVRLGVEVGISARAIIRRLHLTGEDVEVVLGGGVFKGNGTLFLDTINRVIHQEAPRAVIRRLQVEPVAGALMLALEAAGLPVDESRSQAIKSTLPERIKIAWKIDPDVQSESIHRQ